MTSFARAKASGADEQWVTPEGYTQLSERMRRDLGLEGGGYLWFLRSDPDGSWRARKEEELAELIGFSGDEPKKD